MRTHALWREALARDSQERVGDEEEQESRAATPRGGATHGGHELRCDVGIFRSHNAQQLDRRCMPSHRCMHAEDDDDERRRQRDERCQECHCLQNAPDGKQTRTPHAMVVQQDIGKVLLQLGAQGSNRRVFDAQQRHLDHARQGQAFGACSMPQPRLQQALQAREGNRLGMRNVGLGVQKRQQIVYRSDIVRRIEPSRNDQRDSIRKIALPPRDRVVDRKQRCNHQQRQIDHHPDEPRQEQGGTLGRKNLSQRRGVRIGA